jgi:molybdopterin-binding protein
MYGANLSTSVAELWIIPRMEKSNPRHERRLRLSEAAELLGVSADTVRRWIDDGRLPGTLTAGGQRTVARSDVTRFAAERRREGHDRPIAAQSARNRFPGVVVDVRRDKVAAVVEMQAGPHRLVSLITREAADELGLAPGSEVICVVKATDVIIDLPR